jgi:hypothetical protein
MNHDCCFLGLYSRQCGSCDGDGDGGKSNDGVIVTMEMMKMIEMVTMVVMEMMMMMMVMVVITFMMI